MQMQMIHSLAAVFIAIEYSSVAALGNAFLFGKLNGGLKQTPGQKGIVDFVQRRDMAFWNDQQMYRSLRADISKGQNGFVLVNDIRLDVAVYHLAE
jgi:hypothetical protein